MSVLVLYLRLFAIKKWFRYLTQLTMGFVCGYLLANLFTQIFGCSPRPKYYHPDIPGHCIDYTKAGWAYGSMNIASDLIIFVLPLPVLWRLKLSRRDKAGLSFIFMNGAMYVHVSLEIFLTQTTILTLRIVPAQWPLCDMWTLSTRMRPMQRILFGGECPHLSLSL